MIPPALLAASLDLIDTAPVFPALDEPVVKPMSPESPADVCDAVDRDTSPLWLIPVPLVKAILPPDPLVLVAPPATITLPPAVVPAPADKFTPPPLVAPAPADKLRIPPAAAVDLPAVTLILPPLDAELPTCTDILLLPDTELPVDSSTSPAVFDDDDPVPTTRSPLPLVPSTVPMLTLPLDCDEEAPLAIDTEPPVVLLPADNTTLPAVPVVELPDDTVTDPDEPETAAPDCRTIVPLFDEPVDVAVVMLTDPLVLVEEAPLVIVTLPPVPADDDPPVILKLPP